MKMKTFLSMFAGIGIFLLTSPSYALLIQPSDCGTSGTTYILGSTCWTAPLADVTPYNAENVGNVIGVDSLTLLYKSNSPDSGGLGADDGSFSSSYDTMFLNSADDLNSGATISYNTSTDTIVCVECYLTIKDGNHTPGLYAFDISGWNGTDSINLSNFWIGGGAISNVAIWGIPGTTVPEPTSVALMGLGLLGMAAARRRKQP